MNFNRTHNVMIFINITTHDQRARFYTLQNVWEN